MGLGRPAISRGGCTGRGYTGEREKEEVEVEVGRGMEQREGVKREERGGRRKREEGGDWTEERERGRQRGRESIIILVARSQITVKSNRAMTLTDVAELCRLSTGRGRGLSRLQHGTGRGGEQVNETPAQLDRTLLEVRPQER
jgi:hypothetical protein